jgi:cation diffusion facilitator CzcD-associated flavoprotein CzcO
MYKVAIIGAGFGGLGMAARLKESGEESFVILEKAGRLGGTWRENTYPGCACDVPSHLYWYSFDAQPDWSHVFSPQAEILGQLESFAERRGLTPHIRFDTEVATARWDETESCWRIVTKSGQDIEAAALVTAWGQLNRWRMPDMEGRDSFAGVAFHSAQWRQDAVLEGQRVACIGNGASAVQIIPEIAAQAERLTVFQRSAGWVVPRADRAYTDEERKLFASDAQVLLSDREAIYAEHESRFYAMRPGSPKWEEFTGIARAHLEAQVSDPVLRAKLTPDYPLGCKRVLLSDDFYPAMTRPNVELVTERILRIEPAGVRTADGRLHELDVIVFATGFETMSFLSVMDVTGRGGRSLRRAWSDGASAYYGIAVAGFPNFFMLYGPNTNLGHNSIIAMLECQFEYILQALRVMRERRASALEVRADALDRFNRDVEERLQGSAWASGCNSWYKNASGRITNNWCGSVEDYKAETARLQLTDFNLTTTAAELAGSAASD